MKQTISLPSVARLLAAGAVALAAACGGDTRQGAEELDRWRGEVTVEQWEAADVLFHRDPRWLGSDGGISVDLGGDRIAWLFPDTFVAISGANVREESCLVRNSVGLQTGRDPRTAAMTFHWGSGADGLPESFFPKGRDICFHTDDAWLWPVAGVRLGDEGPLLVFLERLRPEPGGLGFAEDGWEAVRVANPDADPGEWSLERAQTRANPWGIVVGAPAILADGDWLYAYGWREPFDVHLARWPLDKAAAGDVRAPAWWAGERRGFVSQDELTDVPPALFGEELPESVMAAEGGGFVATHTVGFGDTSLGLRTSPSLAGSWSSIIVPWRPPESGRSGTLVYGYKLHPELSADGGLALTYATNAEDFGDLVADESVGYPHFALLRPAP